MINHVVWSSKIHIPDIFIDAPKLFERFKCESKVKTAEE